jgi:hypothetical protein
MATESLWCPKVVTKMVLCPIGQAVMKRAGFNISAVAPLGLVESSFSTLHPLALWCNAVARAGTALVSGA